VGNQEESAELRRRIEECETSCCFGTTALQPQTWCSGGVPAKIARLQERLEYVEGAEGKLVSKEQSLEEKLAAAERKVAQLSNTAAHKASLITQATNMFEAAVRTSPTPTLASLEANAAQWRANLEFERTNAAQLEQVKKMCGAARGEYYGAMRALQAASQTNQGAQLNNLIGGRNGGMELMENMQQMQRNRLMEEAQQRAAHGAQVLQQAFSLIPAAAVQRYPHLTGQLGQVSMPSIDQMGFGGRAVEIFGGDFADAMVGMAAQRKIMQGIQALGQCEQVVASQEAMVVALLAAMSQDAAKASASLETTNGQVFVEKTRIFNELRARFGMVQATVVQAQTFKQANEVTAAEHFAATGMQNAFRNSQRQAVAATVGVQPVAAQPAVPMQPAMPQPYAQPYAQPGMQMQPVAAQPAVPMAQPVATAQVNVVVS